MCLGSFGVPVGLFWSWLGVGFGEFALFMVGGFLENFIRLEESLHCSGWLLGLVVSKLEV